MAPTSMVKQAVKLSSGHELPTIGLGVYLSKAGDETYNAVLSALQLRPRPYRHVDTAQIYRNEADVGRAVRDSGVPREQVFLTSKVWLSNWGYSKTLDSVKQSLKTMGLDYLDLMLLHAPGDAHHRADTWRALEDAQKQGLVKSIGVSNFGVPHLEKLATTATIPPAVNQIEVTPFLQRREICEYCKAHNIVVEAYSPLVRGRMDQPELLNRAEQLGKTPAQVLLRWSLQKGYVPLPKSVNPKRQQENVSVFDFELSEEDMDYLDSLEMGLVTGWDPITSDAV